MQADGICCLTKEVSPRCPIRIRCATIGAPLLWWLSRKDESQLKTKRLVIDSMLVAVFFVFSNYLSVNLAGIRISLDVLPVVVAAALYGPMDGLIVGFIGNLLFQLAGPYGISATTVLWAAPDAVRGLLFGIFLKGKCLSMTPLHLIAALIGVALVFTTVTTAVMYVDCLVYKYSFAAYAPFILVRYVTGVAVAVLTAVILPHLIRALDKITGANGGKTE